METRKAHSVPYNELCHHLWDSLAPSLHTLLCNAVGPGQFCALTSECLAMSISSCNMSVHHTSSLVGMLHARSLPVNICPAIVESHAPYLPIFMVLHILHTPSPTGCGFLLVQHTSHTKIKTHSLLQSLPWFWHTIHL